MPLSAPLPVDLASPIELAALLSVVPRWDATGCGGTAARRQLYLVCDLVHDSSRVDGPLPEGDAPGHP